VKSARNPGARMPPTVLTIRSQRGHFIVTSFDLDPVKFKTRRQARDWCSENYPGSQIREAGADGVRRARSRRLGQVRS
jgi:hypothetical protein